MISRRRFLTLGSSIALTAGAGSLTSLQNLTGKKAEPTAADLTRSTFAELLHSAFRLHVEPLQQVEIELIEVGELPCARVAPAVNPEGQFALLFRGPSERPFDQRTYRVEHPKLGEFALFLVPVGQNDRGRLFEAVFNRLAEPPTS